MSGKAQDGGETGIKRSHGKSFSRVLDGRKLPIRGLWTRNGKFSAQLTVADAETGRKVVRRVLLVDVQGQPVKTVAEAKLAQRKLMAERDRGEMPLPTHAPAFAEYADRYLESLAVGDGEKARGTIAKERSCLARWKTYFKGTKLTAIRKSDITKFRELLRGEGLAKRTVNLYVISLRLCLKKALDDGYLKSLPTEGLKPLKGSAPARVLVPMADIEKLCDAALTATKNGPQFADFIRLLAYCGCRYREGLRLRWQDVDFEREQLTIGAAGDTKNHETRRVDFNTKLRAHLRDMHARRAPDSEWLFPSPQRGETDQRALCFRASLGLARTAAGMPAFGFHDCRHSFVSYCVMAGCDFMTIAKWAGHKDGGVLIGRVYGHLADEHRRAQAAKVEFPTNIVPMAQEAGR